MRGFATRSLAAALVAVVLVPGVPIRAQGHLVDPATRDRRLIEQANQRAEDVATLKGAIESQPAAATARAIGVDIRQVSSAIPLLSDAELRDLARRAEALGQNPVGGTSTRKVILIILAALIGLYLLILVTLSLTYAQP
jgi:hypothetical protein